MQYVFESAMSHELNILLPGLPVQVNIFLFGPFQVFFVYKQVNVF